MSTPLARPAPSGFTEAQLDECIEVFQPDSPRPLTHEDAREILHNLTGALQILRGWRRRKHALTSDQAGG